MAHPRRDLHRYEPPRCRPREQDRSATDRWLRQHGDILPLSSDTVVAIQIATAVARANDLRLLPPITVSCSQEHAD